MSLFQKSVLNKYLLGLEKEKVDKAWVEFQKLFHDEERQQIIREANEEKYQSRFLNDLFVKVLGYTQHPDPNHNLVTEQKNESDAGKADGALLDEGKIKAVIELKGTNTVDLDKIVDQGFRYKVNQSNVRYVIISNYEKLRLYIDDAIKYEVFDLFRLNRDRFNVLWLCLEYSNFVKDIPGKIKDSSLVEEEQVTKKLYKDYSDFRKELHQDLIERNSNHDKLILYKKTQKLLDRFLFIFFAEDRGLIPPNFNRKIIRKWTELRDEYDVEMSLYDRFKTNFEYLNVGYKGKEYEVFAYNGGLFQTDELLDELIISDEVLFKYTDRLSEYDFESDVDVNILGHIFEHSLNEIEEINAELKGEEVDTSKTRRKKDGVFYTPKYITQYIVENTLGKLCEEKKAQLVLNDEDYVPNRQRKTKQTLLDTLDTYREYLFSLTICDPACGSGAFLNQALEFLIGEHRYISELEAKLLNRRAVFDVESKILEKNLFGVDINEESVEIAKLSLWLRTAKLGRKLTSLNNNIKCGNSLIDDSEVAGDKAFNWEEEFPDVFANGGFDVVIGNPPYVNVELMPADDKKYYHTKYDTFYKRGDLFSLFIELGIERLTNNGSVSFIVPSIVLSNLSYKPVRDLVLENHWLSEVCYTGNKVFQDVTVDTVIFVLNKKEVEEINLVDALNFQSRTIHTVELDYFEKFGNQISIGNKEEDLINDKLFDENHSQVEDHFNVFQGIVTGNNEAFIFDNEQEAYDNSIEKDLLNTLCHGRDISKWFISNFERKILYVNNDIDIDSYPGALNWLEDFESKISKSKSSKERSSDWYCLHRPRVKEELDQTPKIAVQNTRNERLQPRIVATIDTYGIYASQGINFIIPTSNELSCYYLLGILNSTLINYLFSTKFLNLAIKAEYLKKLRVPFVDSDVQKKMESLTKGMTDYHYSLEKLRVNFLDLLQSKFDIEKLSRKLQSWHELTFKQFLKELKKKKVKLPPKESAEWMEYFNQQKAQADDFKSQIAQMDKEIDAMVHELYGLTDEEVAVVEESFK